MLNTMFSFRPVVKINKNRYENIDNPISLCKFIH